MLLSAGVMGVFAQTTETAVASSEAPLTKSGYKILPEKGDFAIGIDATPILVNLFNVVFPGGGVDPTFGNDEYTIYGQYFLENNRSVRASLGIGVINNTYKGTVQDDFAFNQPGYNGQTAIDVLKENETEVNLNVGYVFHRGYRRLQGFYGPQVGVSYETGKGTYTYANPITAGNTDPSAAFAPPLPPAAPADSRVTEVKQGNTFGFNVGGFAGVEYFIAPKLSIGGEVGVAFEMSNTTQNETTYEYWDGAQGSVQTNTVRSFNAAAPSGNISFKTIGNGNIFLSFYF